MGLVPVDGGFSIGSHLEAGGLGGSGREGIETENVRPDADDDRDAPIAAAAAAAGARCMVQSSAILG
jgi:hypothetical protein